MLRLIKIIALLATVFILLANPAFANEVSRYKAIPVEGNAVFVIDTQEGHCWIYLSATELPKLRYMGKVRPGKKFFETIEKVPYTRKIEN